jgi:alkanesulfonate monooxygenase SsuD/methylene tetrahydromethanopterin reductase-like flavin-dependent oxidoreductase (luciferase family)
MALIELGLFDIQQIDPLDDADIQTYYNRRLDNLELADQSGLNIAFVAERHYLTTYNCQSSSVWIAAATQRTKNIRLGTLAYTLPITPPLRLAEEIATLDLISGGRIEVGVGLGHRVEELEANGIDASKRIDIFQERLAVLEGLLNGGTVTYEGDGSSLKNAFISPRPLQDPHPPLWFAGIDPTSSMWAGQHGMNLAIGFAPDDHLFGATASFRHGMGIRRTRTKELDSVRRGAVALMRHVYIAETDEQAYAEMVEHLMRLDEIDVPATQENRAERRAIATQRQKELVGKNVFVAGSPDTVAHAILNARNTLGAGVFLGNPYGGGITQEQVQRTIKLLASDVRDCLDASVTRIG